MSPEFLLNLAVKMLAKIAIFGEVLAENQQKIHLQTLSAFSSGHFSLSALEKLHALWEMKKLPSVAKQWSMAT